MAREHSRDLAVAETRTCSLFRSFIEARAFFLSSFTLPIYYCESAVQCRAERTARRWFTNSAGSAMLPAEGRGARAEGPPVSGRLSTHSWPRR